MNIKNILLAVVVLAVVGVAGWLLLMFFNQPIPVASTIPTPSVSPELTTSPSPVVSKNVVIYTDSGFSPSTITIKKGEEVTWKNQSSDGIWTASDPHPSHTGYPIDGGCIDSIFDECEADAPGTEWSFTFTVSGTWSYHNHRNFSHAGKVIVQ